MLEKIKNNVLAYYFLVPVANSKTVTYQDRVELAKNMLDRVFLPIVILGLVLIILNIFNIPLVSKFVFPFFLASIFPYYIYGVVVWLLYKEKKQK